MLDEPHISTITWFRGDRQAAVPLLKKRLATITERNPWLKGRVVKREQVKLFLVFKEEFAGIDNATYSSLYRQLRLVPKNAKK